MIIKSQEANQKNVGPMVISEYKINSDFSAALIEINGDHGTVKCIKEDRIYFIIDGTGNFVIDDKETEVGPNDLIFVPKNVPYNFIGKFRFFLVCSPEFNPEDDISI